MITQTPRTDPMASASPSASRYTPNKPATPITPSRYRSPPSLSHAFPSTPTSRRGSLAESGDDSPPSKSSTSNWQASVELSLTTRRRLIRKPLPQIPSSQLSDPIGAHNADSDLIDSSALDAQYHKADSWWPDALPEKQLTTASASSRPSTASLPTASSSRITATAEPSTSNIQQHSNHGQGLDEQSLRHLITILHHAALRHESESNSTHDHGTIGRNVVVSATGTYKKQASSNGAAASSSTNTAAQSLYVLDEATLESLYTALQAAFRHLSHKHVLGALQRTASIRWRAEAQLRNATAAQAAEANNGLSSRWARFAWPAAALGRAYKEAQKNILPPLPGDVASSGFSSASHLQLSHDLYSGLYSDPDHRIRKRDVAVKILSNAIWFVRNYGPVAGVETLEAPSDKNALIEASAASRADDGLPPPSLSSVRRTSESLLKKNAGLPNFLSKSSATTALSGTATPESSQSDVPTPLDPPSSASSTAPLSPAPVQDVFSISSSTSSPHLATTSSETALHAAAGSSTAISETNVGLSSENVAAAAEKSKAMEHLASLSAAAGAAMRQRAQQAAAAAAANGGKPEDSIDAAIAASGTLHPQSSRPSLRSFVSRSEAEAAETDALQKAERDYLAEIGQGCDEWAKMVVCRLCASIQVANAPDKARRRRSGTLTARDFNKASAAIEDTNVGSSISTRSDMTAKAGKVGHAKLQCEGQTNADKPSGNHSEGLVSWKPDVFEGDELFAHHGTSSHERRTSVSPHDEDERVRLVGGSFVCRVQTEEQRQALTELLEIALYVGMSMLLESSFLSDSDAARPKILKVPTRTTSAVDAPQRGASLVQQPILSRATSQQSLDSSRRSVSGSSSHAGMSNNTDAVADAHEAESAQSKPGSRKWTKSLWGMLGQHPHGSADAGTNAAGGRPGTSDGHEVSAAPRKSLTMHRYHTEDDANSLASSTTRKTLFKAGEEPKQSIAARKAALFANVSNNNSAPATPQGGRGAGADAGGHSKPHRLVGRLMNAFSRPSASDPPRPDIAVPSTESSHAVSSSRTSIGAAPSLPSADGIVSRSRATTETKMSNFQRLRAQAKPQPIFPVTTPSPAALSTSPELSMLVCYQYQVDPKQPTFPTAAYLTAFHRLQSLRFLADQRREHMTFASPSHGISASGDLLPFVGVQKPSSSSAWSVLSSRPQQQLQVGERASPSSVQLLSYELLSGDGSALGLCREEVAFYQRLSNSRDVPLGQVIEELGIRACALEADRDVASKASDSRIVSGKTHGNAGKDRNDVSAGQGVNSAYGMPEQRLQFIHGSCRIKIVATVLPSRLYEIETEPQRNAESEAEKASTDSTLQVGSTAVSPSLKPTKSRESDVSAIAAASHTDKEAANTAFAVAETAVQAAESGTSRPLVDQRGSGSTSGIWMWNASAKSGWQGKAMPMSESTYLLSFARYLEAISYHPALRRAAGLEPANAKAYGGLANVQQQLRQGRSEDARSVAEGPNLLRFFRSGRSLVKVQVQPLVLYDLHIQGPCLKTGSERRRERKQKQVQAEKRRFKQLAEETRLEIQRFFASIKSNTTKLEDIFVSRELDEAGKTIRRRSTARNAGGATQSQTEGGLTASSSSSTVSEQVAEPLNLLTNLRTSLRSDEFELYEALQRTFFLDGINDVRKAFADRAKSAKNRLAAWTKKHLTKKEQADFGSCNYDEPEYLEPGRRAFPGSCYIIRDDEPLSIIAFSLSSRDFRAEMGTLADRRQEAAGYMGNSNDELVKQWRSGVVDDGETATVGSYISSSAASTATAASSLLKDRSMRKVPFSQLDPDKDEVFFDAEPVRAALKRKKRGRESSILSLTLRRVGSTISDSQGVNYRTVNANGRPTSSAGSFKDHDEDDDDDGDDDDDEEGDARSSVVQSSTDGQDTTLGAPRTDTTPLRRPSAAILDQTTPSPIKPHLRTSGSVSALRRTFELRSQSSFSSIPDRKSSIQQQPGQSVGTSTISTTSTDTTFHAQVTPVSGRPASLASIFFSTNPASEGGINSRISSAAYRPGARSPESATGPRAIPRSTSTSRQVTSAVAETALDTGSKNPSNGTPPTTSEASNPHKLAAQPSSSTSEGVAGADAQSMVSNSTLPGSQAAESPHIKHNLIHGTTKISCVSWFAEEFAALRERWGVEHDFAHSLSRCQPWVATGGKSKSAFFKTADERFIAKQLLTVWSVDEKEAFLEFAPAYIRYMMNSAVNDCPTLLVKIAGVYSIKIKDTKSGETKLKMNVMLLENLWAGDGGKSIRFDLKGIRDRKVKLSAQQQQSLQQQQVATTAGAVNGPVVGETAGSGKAGLSQGSVSAAWNGGVLSMSGGESGVSNDAGSGSTQTSPNRKAGETTPTTTTASSATEAKPSSTSSAVWWDSEWIERYRHRAFVPETQKELFYRALQNDTQFLTASNVMDYSLLLGVMEQSIRQDDMYPPAAAAAAVTGGASPGLEEDQVPAERPSFRCRIVDFLGAFTLAKQLESSSKKALKGQDAKGNVTILPPSEYASRFLGAMDSYFIGTPCQPRLDGGYGFDRMCEAAATMGETGEGGARRPRLASVL
ncbi:related to phosphatidylinositol 3-phosphate 5-kinase [Ustilago trichophora]|uniref:Related to phosphatidylinositol 3-phosphate 5-kinase n=1 Tax=Ustilago trichophora TaxID=86804 RepID=A0A5C3EQ68_9BASI|nr:related to phosphatidylinositol 3-phosphate 5-kinase [Ustilago trichophora]